MTAPFISQVREAQANVCQYFKNVIMIPTSTEFPPTDFPKYDKFHLNTEGVLKLGKKAGELMFEKLPQGE